MHKIKRKESKNTILQKIIKSQRNRPRQGERNKGTTKQPENNEQNGNNKSKLMNNYFQCK